ncbi:MAG: hypothetical protein PHS14_12115 [Elusimicrobia bacterium]|nr:hypothetical protein [Elusimicrobiota bacterium]
MTKIPMTVVAAALLTTGIALAQVTVPPPQDRTAVETDKKEVARAISALKPNGGQLDDLMHAQKAARAALQANEKAAEKQAMLDKMR